MGYLNEKLYLQAPGHLDWKLKPFSSKAVALASMPYWQREIGQVVNVVEGGTTVRYWFKDGVLDADLVLLDTVTTDGTTITGTGTTTDPVKSYNAGDGTKYLADDGTWKSVSGTIPISPSVATRNEAGYITKNIVTVSEGVTIESRFNYADGIMTFFEIKNQVTGEWKRVTINYTEAVYTSKTVEIIEAWTI